MKWGKNAAYCGFTAAEYYMYIIDHGLGVAYSRLKSEKIAIID